MIQAENQLNNPKTSNGNIINNASCFPTEISRTPPPPFDIKMLSK